MIFHELENAFHLPWYFSWVIQAALFAGRANRTVVSNRDMHEARDKVLMGVERRSVRGKVTALVVSTTLAALVVTAVALIYYNVHDYRDAQLAEMRTQAEILGRASALTAQPWVLGERPLSTLKAWEPEPCRWLGYNAIVRSFVHEDRVLANPHSAPWRRALAARLADFMEGLMR